MNAIDWLDKQVEIIEEQLMYQNFRDRACTILPINRTVYVHGLEELAKEISKVVRNGCEKEDCFEEFFEYKGVRFSEWKEKKDGK